MKKYIATFYSHFGAVRFVRELREKGFEGKIMPVPRDLSSSCGSCVYYEADTWLEDSAKGEIEQTAEVLDKGYEIVYRAAD